MAELGIQAAHAIDHAHQNGIVHRDVKPGNLLIDTDGKLWLTDFGLAHIESDKSLTMTGDLVGTLRYMSPEQVQAPRAVIDYRTDIYSLGATLYELITLQPACRGAGRQELLKEIAEDEPISPGRISTIVPRDLVTIVLKAMEKRPQDRYHTARELADDLTRFLENRPIHATLPTPAGLVVKWVRRHKRFTAAAAVLFVLGSIGLAVSNLMLAHERDQKDAALQVAEANLSRALDGVDKLLANVADERVLNAPQLAGWQREIAGEALALCETLLQMHPEDPRVSRRTALAHLQKGKIYYRLGEYQAAEEALQKSSVQLKQLVWQTTNPEEKERHEALLLDNHQTLAGILTDIGRYEESASLLRGAIDLGGRLIASHPETLQYSVKVADSHALLGEVHREQGRREDAQAAYREALRMRQQLVQCRPDDAKLYHALASSYLTLGDLRQNPSASYEKAIRLTRSELEREPANIEAKCTLANAQMQLAKWHSEQGHLAIARRGYEDAIAILEMLIQDHPLIPRYQIHLGHVCLHHGDNYSAAGQKDEAATWYKQAVTALAAVVSQNATNRDTEDYLVLAHERCGDALTKLNRYDDAARSYDAAIDILDHLAEDRPRKYQSKLASTHHSKAHAMEGSGQTRLGEQRQEAVLKQWQTALDAYRQLIDNQPDHPDHLIDLVEVKLCLSSFLGRQGRDAESQAADQDVLTLLRNMPESIQQQTAWRTRMARALIHIDGEDNIREAIRLRELLVTENIEDRYEQHELANCLRKLGNYLREENRFDEAESPLRRAIQIREELVASDPDPRFELMERLANCQACLGYLFKKANRSAECIDAYRRAIATQTEVMQRWPSEWELFALMAYYKEVYEMPCTEEQLEERVQWKSDWLASYQQFEATFSDELNPDDPRASKPCWQNMIAWGLAHCPHASLRDAAQAVQFAQDAVNKAPKEADYWNTLGTAQYRAGDWEESIKTLETAMKLRSGGESSDFLFLAMAHWQMGHTDEARCWYDRAVAWMDKNKPDDGELRRFRAEAVALLEIEDKDEA